MTIETITSKNGRRIAIISEEYYGIEVTFGQDIGGEFIPRHYNSSRTYKTLTGARRAANGWISNS